MWLSQRQNHRTVDVGRGLLRSPSPTPLPKQAQLQQAAQDHVWLSFKCLHKRRLPNLSGQPVPIFTTLTAKKKIILHLMEAHMFQFMSIASWQLNDRGEDPRGKCFTWRHERLREASGSGIWSLQCHEHDERAELTMLWPPLASQKAIPPSKEMLLCNSNINSPMNYQGITYESRNNDDSRWQQTFLFPHLTKRAYFSNTLLSPLVPYWINRQVKSFVTLAVTHWNKFWPARGSLSGDWHPSPYYPHTKSFSHRSRHRLPKLISGLKHHSLEQKGKSLVKRNS